MAQLINTTINGSLEVTGITKLGEILDTENKRINIKNSGYIYLNFFTNSGTLTESYLQFSQADRLTSDTVHTKLNANALTFAEAINICNNQGTNTIRYSDNKKDGGICIGNGSTSKGPSIVIGSNAVAGANLDVAGYITTYTGGIAIGNDAKCGAGTNIGAGDQYNSGSHGGHLSLGVGGVLWKYMSAEGGEWMDDSDYRDKTDFLNIESEKALNFISSLQGKTYVYNHRHDYKDENGNFDEASYLAGTKKHNRRQAGFIAQDTYQSMINIFQDDNYADIVDYSKYDYPDIEEDQYSMAKTALIPFLVEAIKEQQKQIEELKNEIKNMREL